DCRSLPTRNSRPRFDAPTSRLRLSMNPMPPNILTSVTPLTPDSAERTARISSGSSAADWALNRDEAFGIALSLAELPEQAAKTKQRRLFEAAPIETKSGSTRCRKFCDRPGKLQMKRVAAPAKPFL